MEKAQFRALPGAIKPKGWLRRQLEIQAQGLSGHLDQIWPDVKNSRWIGGDREGWERVPYWLDGFIPLAWILDDEDMKARAKRYMDAILAGQQEDGWICPCGEKERSTYDMWALLLIAKVMTVYADYSGDPRVQPALERALKQFSHFLDGHTLFGWGASRWFEGLIAIFWLYDKTQEPWLEELGQKLRSYGVDYEKLFKPFRHTKAERNWSFNTHVVNLAMALKSGALAAQLEGGDPDALALLMLDKLGRYHGTATGHFTGDECLAGNSPVQGTGLCSVVEAMYSYEVLLAVSGNPIWADRLEMLAFNALPATCSEDMWTHQYDQQVNQIACKLLPEDQTVFLTNGPDSHLFGLEPNFGCCTANFNQGWPKLAASCFMGGPNGGLVSALPLPCELNTKINGIPVQCEVESEYPFKGQVTYHVKAQRPVEFTLYIRIPGWADRAWLDGRPVPTGGYFTVRRTWREDTIALRMEFDARLEDRPRKMHCLRRGPLLYSVPIAQRWEQMEYKKNGVERKYPYCDYQVFPESDWAFGFAGDEFTAQEKEVGEIPFSFEHPPVTVEASMAPLPWREENGVAAILPESREPLAAARKMELIPYGCARLRMTEMPKTTRFTDKPRFRVDVLRKDK